MYNNNSSIINDEDNVDNNKMKVYTTNNDSCNEINNINIKENNKLNDYFGNIYKYELNE